MPAAKAAESLPQKRQVICFTADDRPTLACATAPLLPLAKRPRREGAAAGLGDAARPTAARVRVEAATRRRWGRAVLRLARPGTARRGSAGEALPPRPDCGSSELQGELRSDEELDALFRSLRRRSEPRRLSLSGATRRSQRQTVSAKKLRRRSGEARRAFADWHHHADALLASVDAQHRRQPSRHRRPEAEAAIVEISDDDARSGCHLDLETGRQEATPRRRSGESCPTTPLKRKSCMQDQSPSPEAPPRRRRPEARRPEAPPPPGRRASVLGDGRLPGWSARLLLFLGGGALAARPMACASRRALRVLLSDAQQVCAELRPGVRALASTSDWRELEEAALADAKGLLGVLAALSQLERSGGRGAGAEALAELGGKRFGALRRHVTLVEAKSELEQARLRRLDRLLHGLEGRLVLAGRPAA